MNEFEWPFDNDLILSKKRSIKKRLLNSETKFIDKKIAILGGSTTSEIKNILELFLLNYGIKPQFYESEYNQFWQDAMFPPENLKAFCPDIIYIHTSNRNIENFPSVLNTVETIDQLLEDEYSRFEDMWENLSVEFGCPIIQNNMELLYYRMLGNKDASDFHGKNNFISRFNDKLYNYSRTHDNFYINDINWLSASYGLDKWCDQFYWHMYKYSLCLDAVPCLAHNVANIIKAIYGKNKKALVLDLDNTLWGGVVGDDGVENLEIGQETSIGQAYSEFQRYIQSFKDIGILLNVCSKNEMENAIAGLEHPDGLLRPKDFIIIKADWEPKSLNIEEIARELNILCDSIVFVDDNPAEREIVNQQLNGVATPEVSKIENYIREIDHQGYFEVVDLSQDDLNRSGMYKANIERAKERSSFSDYNEYLRSLNMKGTIKPFEPIYMARIAQLTNKSNQFNLTTKRYSQNEIEGVANNKKYISLYGKLEDKFGDNGVVSVVIGRQENRILHIDLWIMSCRVLKRDMEYAMMDELVYRCRSSGIEEIRGYYYPTVKNGMVKDFYAIQGFEKISEDNEGNTVWSLRIDDTYTNKNSVIKMEG